MKLTHLTIDNIRSHVHTSFDLERLSIFRGPNGTGKSSIRDAIEFALTGRCDVTDAAGRGQEDLLHRGTDKAAVTLGFQKRGESYELRASLTRASGRNVTLRKPSQKDWPSGTALEYFTKQRDLINCVCNTRHFVNLSAKDQKALLARVLLPQSYEFDPKAKDNAVKARIDVPWGSAPIAVIDAGYKVAYEARTGIRRALKELPIPDEQKTEGSAADIQTALRDRRTSRDKLVSDRALLVSKHQKERDLHGRAVAAATDIRAKIESEERGLGTVTERLLTKDQLKTQQKIADQAKSAQKLEAAIEQLQAEQKSVDAQLAELDALGENSSCPTCKQPLTEEAIAAVGAPLIERKNKIIRDLNASWEQRKKVGDSEGAQKRVDAHKSDSADAQRMQARLAELRTSLTSAEEQAAAKPPEAPDTSQVDSQIVALDERLDKGQSALAQAARAEESNRLRAQSLQKQKELEAQQEALEELCAYFGPSGVKVQIIQALVGDFLGHINRILGQWGYRADLKIEPEYSFMVHRTGFERDSLGLHQLSQSERHRFALAFQVALSLSAGIGFVIVDEADMLDQDGRAKLYQALYHTGGLEQVIVLITDERRDTNAAPETIFYLLSEGAGVTSAELLRHNPALQEVSA